MGAAVESGAAGKESVAIANLHNILLGAACRHDRACGAFFPKVNVMLCVESDNALACCAGGRLDSDAVFEVCAEKSIGICLAQIRLGEEGQLVNILHTLDVLGFYAFFVHQVAVIFDVFINVLDLLDDFFILNCQYLFTGGCFNFGLKKIAHRYHSFCKNSSPKC